MNNEKVILDESDFNLDFLSIDHPIIKKNLSNPYKVLIVDDDPEIHVTTKMILKNFLFEGRGLEFIDVYTGLDAIEALKNNQDISIVLLDVVMEENDSGLKVVEYIRNTMKNIFIRIILRTGQPGYAPEERIISDYEINDYLLKTEITVQRLFTSFFQNLRAYRDLMYIKNNK
jgi:CheY-like chemotaxis protein